jgi:hypothetical protein
MLCTGGICHASSIANGACCLLTTIHSTFGSQFTSYLRDVCYVFAPHDRLHTVLSTVCVSDVTADRLELLIRLVLPFVDGCNEEHSCQVEWKGVSCRTK